MWLFAYGSLIFRPAFVFAERRRAFVAGYARRFWQGSPDHRGVPSAPGRVVTLVPAAGETCGGVAYRIEPQGQEAILAALDEREKAGFERRLLPLLDVPGGSAFAEGVVYVADEANPHFLGDAGASEIASWIARSRGPSGPNSDYVHHLASALRDLDLHDPHVETIAQLLAPS